ncbi:MAG: arsenic resistance protein [Burkholderiales bacterium RIFCSPHIGHO2_01_FULL_64_960]|nr:MAG: arsenic resistance protein [Burkholderiales bacterium RIFCSPHIGHO2_01_FULL_64_960]
MQHVRDTLERQQIWIYFGTVVVAGVVALSVSGTGALERAINPALAVMLYVTFLQVPMAELKRAFGQVRFLGSLLVANFVFIPLLVGLLIQLLPADPMLRLGVLLVLLTPCIDYVVTFAHLGRADARLLLAATPVLLIAQMVLLPGYLRVFLGEDAARLVQAGPFIDAFVWLIAVPLVLAAAMQFWAAKSKLGSRISTALGLFPVPATSLVLFVVVAAVVPQLGPAIGSALRVVPVYIAFAVLAPLLGWMVARLFQLGASAGRSIAFSASTRNSLVVLPLALAVPGAVPILPAVIVTQTLVELLAELVYVRWMPKLGQQ